MAPDVVEYIPELQLRHTVDDVAPTVVEYVPATQLTHLVLLKYDPAWHDDEQVETGVQLFVR